MKLQAERALSTIPASSIDTSRLKADRQLSSEKAVVLKSTNSGQELGRRCLAMNWAALFGVAFFGGHLLFGLGTGSMITCSSWWPNRDEEPGWFWMIGALDVAFLLLSLTASVGLIK